MTSTARLSSSRRPLLERLEERCVLNAAYHPLLAGDFYQDWSDTSLIAADNNWTNVPSVIGYRGDGLAGSAGADPRNVTAFAGPGGPVVHALANRTNPDTLTTGGVAEFHLADPAVALQGSGTARAPFVLVHLNTTGMSSVFFYLELRDLDGSDDDVQTEVAVQYRIGDTGDFTNVPEAYVADASEGPFLRGLVTPVFATLPAEANNQARLQLRILTTDAVGTDEWIGVDTIYVTAKAPPPPASDSLRIAVYNVAAPGGNTRPGLDTVLYAIGNESVGGQARPIDVLALQEVRNQATTTEFVVGLLNGIYGAGVYARGTRNGATTGGGTQGLVYNTQTVQLVAEAVVGTASTTGQPRQALRYHLRPVGTNGEADFFVYNSHMKAINDAPSRDRRLVEANALRADADALGQGANVLFVGDFNLYTSAEPAYQRLLAGGNGQAFDPLNRPGNWHLNAAFRDIFTQAPSRIPLPGLTGGGIDDRFDFQLFSNELTDGFGLDYRSGSYHTFGVNGSLPLNVSVNDSRNTALPDLPNRLEVLDFLATVTDHLPVVADYLFAPGSGPRSGSGRETLSSAVADLVAALIQTQWSGAVVRTHWSGLLGETHDAKSVPTWTGLASADARLGTHVARAAGAGTADDGGGPVAGETPWSAQYLAGWEVGRG